MRRPSWVWLREFGLNSNRLQKVLSEKAYKMKSNLLVVQKKFKKFFRFKKRRR